MLCGMSKLAVGLCRAAVVSCGFMQQARLTLLLLGNFRKSKSTGFQQKRRLARMPPGATDSELVTYKYPQFAAPSPIVQGFQQVPRGFLAGREGLFLGHSVLGVVQLFSLGQGRFYQLKVMGWDELVGWELWGGSLLHLGLGSGAEFFAEDDGFGDLAHGFALLAA
jgi:hypothetical protein